MKDPRPIQERINQQLESLIIDPTIRAEAVRRMLIITGDEREDVIYAFTLHRYQGYKAKDVISQIDFIANILRKGKSEGINL